MPLVTIEDIVARNQHLEIKCLVCERTVLIPPALIEKHIPRDLPARLAAAHYRCSQCQGKQLQSRMYDVRKLPGRASWTPPGWG